MEEAKKLFNKYFFVAACQPPTKKAGYGCGIVGPYQNVADQRHCFLCLALVFLSDPNQCFSEMVYPDPSPALVVMISMLPAMLQIFLFCNMPANNVFLLILQCLTLKVTGISPRKFQN
jgi:hypothetical protein